MIHEVFMPALSSTMTEGKIVAWVKSPGDKVEKGETVVIVESDKADMDVEAFYEGYLATIVVEAGDVAPVGQAIALLAETEAEIEAVQKQGAAANKPTAPASVPAASSDAAPTAAVSTPAEITQNGADSSSSSSRIIVSPRARKLAKGLKVDLGEVKGTGPHGRIVAHDIEIAAGRTPTLTAPALGTPTPSLPPVGAIPTPRPVSSTPAPAPAAAGQIIPFTTLQQAVVRTMLTSLAAPTYRVGYTITTDNLDTLYQQIKSKGVTMTAMLSKAVAVTLQKHPLLNASYTDQGVQYGAGVNIAVAVAMEDGGLITPVLKQADQIDIYSLSQTWKDLVNRARAKQLQPDEYNSGTFTLSNLGMFGVDRFDAILPPGQGAILAIGASRPQVAATPEGMMGIRRQMQVNITCDHRIIYGAHAAAVPQGFSPVD